MTITPEQVHQIIRVARDFAPDAGLVRNTRGRLIAFRRAEDARGHESGFAVASGTITECGEHVPTRSAAA
jgi:hypothetical protein